MRKNRQRSNYADTFHLPNFLDEHGISYRTHGKNIGAGWLGIETCPFCTGGGFHFGVHAQSKTGSCWICGEKCSPLGLVMVLLDCQKREAFNVIREFSSDNDDWIPEPDFAGDTVILPSQIDEELSQESVQYLKGRGFDPYLLETQFKIKSTPWPSFLTVDGRRWNFARRILAPVYMGRRLQCYVARDFTDEQEPKYMNCPVVASVLEPHSCIYNYDTLGEKSIFVEGITDVWRMGNKVGAFLGITFTKKQLLAVSRKKVKDAVILFDAGAEDRAKKLAYALAPVIERVRIATLEKDDPGKLTEDEALKLKYQLIGEI